MKTNLLKTFLPLLISITLLMVLADSAGAQTPTATPTSPPISTIPPTPILSPTPVSLLPTDVVRLENPDIVTFSQLGQSEIQLDGPYDSSSFSFALPADWVLKDEVQLVLLVGVSFNDGDSNNGAGAQTQSDVIVIGGGILTVRLNKTVLLSAPLNEVGETEIKINIPSSLFTTTSDDGRMSLQFGLDSGSSCRIIGSHTTVFIHSSSYFNFPHDFAQPSTSLVNFPRPIIQNSFFPDSALIVIPDQPTAAELQAALTVAAGFGNLSSNRLKLDMVTLGNLTEDLTKQQLIFIGKASSMPLLDGLNLPLPSKGGQFQFSEDGVDDGLIEMINSPWSNSHVALIVSANTDAGLVKAAQAVSSGVIRPNKFENLAVIEQVNILPISGPQKIDQSLSDLGYDISSFQRRGLDNQDYNFYLPPGMTVSTEAYFDMVYGHSSLIDYNASQIVIYLNDQPIGSVRMSDATADVPTNHAKIMIPPLATLPGNNQLTVEVTLESVDDCAPPDSSGLWVNIWPESLIHLPLMAASLDPLTSQDLEAYPSPFVYNSTLGDTAFVLEHNDPASWRSAMQIAAFLGNYVDGSLIQLSAFYGDAMPVTERSKYHLLVIGRPSQMPIVGEMNNDLPAPFLTSSDTVSESGNFPVTYRIPADSPMGYVETILSPWNAENVVLAILGNTVQGVNWAATALVDPTLRGQLTGNFAVVNNNQIISTNTRNAETGSGVIPSLEMPSIESTPLSDTTTDLPKTRPGWILPILVVSIGLIVIIIVVVMIQYRSRINTRKHGDETQRKDGSDDSQKQS